MANPVLVEVTRGTQVESRHRGAVAVVDADGAIVLEVGDIARPVFPRSTAKAIQALPLVESGAADRYGFGARELALACASHSGETGHAETAASMLARSGLDGAALECGSHWPTNDEAARALVRAGTLPDALHNNCSGKHAGFICTCVHLGIGHRGYVAAGHAAQEQVREAMEDVTGARHGPDNCGIDGCAIPTYAVPLADLARGFARMATGIGLTPGRAAAAKRLIGACMSEPWFMAGTGRADTRMMEAGRQRVFTKTGAEGVHCAALPEWGLGVAIKCDDGADRAAATAVASVLAQLCRNDAELASAMRSLSRSDLYNRSGAVVGEIRPAGPLANDG